MTLKLKIHKSHISGNVPITVTGADGKTVQISAANLQAARQSGGKPDFRNEFSHLPVRSITVKTSFYAGGSICLNIGINISGTLTVPGPDGKPVQISQTALQNAQNAMFTCE